MIKIIKLLDKYIFYAIVFLFPLFLLPIFSNYFETAKLLLLVSGILLLSIVKIIGGLTDNSFRLSTSKIDIFIVIFSVVYIVSGLVISPNRLDAFFVPGTATFVVLSSLVYFFTTQLSEKDKKGLEFVLILSTLIAAGVQVASFVGLIQKNFSTFGNLITSFTYYAAILPIAFYKVFKKEKIVKNIFFGIASFIILVGTFISLYQILPGKNSVLKLPKLSTSWSIAIDTLKQSPLLGIGPANYLESYNKYRPIAANSDDTWTARFLVSSDTPLTILSEVGIIGLLAFLAIFYFSLRKLKLNNPIYVSLLIIFIISLILPLPVSAFPLMMLLFALNTMTHENVGNFSSKTPIIIISVPLALLIAFVSFFAFKYFYAEYTFSKVITEMSKGNGVKAYEEINKTININPYVDRYHLVSASIDTALAGSLAKIEKLTDEDKTTLTQLIQQAVEEGKAAVTLNSRSASNWENLGDIYNSITSFAKDADSFAIQAYSQAIYLDPINPTLRIKLGGIYYAQGKFADAAKVFELAVVAKPDFANAHYNLAMAYKEDKQLDKAKEQMNLTLSLLGKDSQDFETAKKELETIEGLTPPQPSSAPVIEPPIEVPATQ
jgi:tetratricopeptide (TPR) repeat protein